MILVHRLKAGEHEIPIDHSRALRPDAFATYSAKRGDTTTHLAIGWTLRSAQEATDGKRGKYQDHEFELRFPPEVLDQVIAALQVAKQRFAGDPEYAALLSRAGQLDVEKEDED